jgi:hypothetical protein
MRWIRKAEHVLAVEDRTMIMNLTRNVYIPLTSTSLLAQPQHMYIEVKETQSTYCLTFDKRKPSFCSVWKIRSGSYFAAMVFIRWMFAAGYVSNGL